MNKTKKQDPKAARTPSKAKAVAAAKPAAKPAIVASKPKKAAAAIAESKEANGAYSKDYQAEMVRLMVEKNISANKLSAETGISQPTLSRWKRQAEARAGKGKVRAVESEASKVEVSSAVASLGNRVLMFLIDKDDLGRVLAEAIG